jgi:hypothetical protein
MNTNLLISPIRSMWSVTKAAFGRRLILATLYAATALTVTTGRLHAQPDQVPSAATKEAEARALFTKFVAAQNAHSVSGVKAMLWNSPGTLLLARGAEIRGPEPIADRFKEYYEGTWHVEPDMSLFHVTLISKDVMEFVVPVVFTRGLPGQPSQDNKRLITQTLVHDANGWHIASIISIANTQPK